MTIGDNEALQLTNVRFSYCRDRDVLPVLDGISLECGTRRVATIVGPSGCGKSTLLNLIAGLVLADSGTVVSPLGGCAYVFQAPSLIPWMDVERNAMFGAELSGHFSEALLDRCRTLLYRFGLEGFEKRFPSSLSGGMQQRVSIIRAVLSGARVLLLDEAFSGSDYLVRLSLQRELSRLVEEEGLIGILATHDVTDAVRMADTVLILSGRPARVKGEIHIDVPRIERLANDPAAIKLMAPYLERVWEVLRTPNGREGLKNGEGA